MSYKFMAEDFYDAINSVGALGSFPHDLGEYFIRNSDKYKEACSHLHKDMLEQALLVADMDTLPVSDKLHPFELMHDQLLIALQADRPDMKRMLSVNRYTPEGGGNDEMIVVPLIAGRQKHQWQPIGIVIFLRELDDAEEMQIRAQEFPGAIVPKEKQDKITSVILDALNIIATATDSNATTMLLREPSKLKTDRAAQKDKNIILKPFTVMSA
jgi:hypothetical protein